MNFENEFNQKVDEIELIIKKYLPEEKGYQKSIMEAMNYSIMAGGKRIRPMLMYETFRLFQGYDEEVIYPFMAAMEMIHTYSLVHDDLPSMDNDDYRRGRLTTHKVYGEAMGVLAGDALLNYAYETAMKAFDCTKDVLRVAKALQILANKAGIYGMVGGQVADVEESGDTTDVDRLHFIYKNKTSALIEASMMIGAVLANASDDKLQKIEQIGENIGLAFQIQDDILDVTGKQEVIGKPIHSDKKNNKTTFVTIYGIEKAKQSVVTYSNEALLLLNELTGEKEYLVQLFQMLMKREK